MTKREGSLLANIFFLVLGCRVEVFSSFRGILKGVLEDILEGAGVWCMTEFSLFIKWSIAAAVLRVWVECVSVECGSVECRGVVWWR